MGIDMDTSQIPSANAEEGMSVLSMFVIMVGAVLTVIVIFVIVGSALIKRRQRSAPSQTESVHHPTDYMNNLASWDSSLSLDEMLEKKRRSVWSLDIFDNLTSNGTKNDTKICFQT